MFHSHKHNQPDMNDSQNQHQVPTTEAGPIYDGTGASGGNEFDQGQIGQDPTAGAGLGAGATHGRHQHRHNHHPHNENNNGIAPVSALASTPARPSTKGARRKRTAGKVELVIGKILHSPALKARGMAKVKEANAIQAQSMELDEAEALEAEARLRRERAEAHALHSGVSPSTGGYDAAPHPAFAAAA